MRKGASPEYVPTNINTLVSQINSSKPYVSKQITWIFQHTLAIIPELDNMPSWTNQYSPEMATKRKSYVRIMNPFMGLSAQVPYK